MYVCGVHRAAVTIVLACLTLGGFAQSASARRMPVSGLTAHFTGCPDYEDGGSCASPETAEIWLAPDADEFDFWHEVGHVFDHQALDGRARAWLTRKLGFSAATPWTSDAAEADIAIFGTRTPDEVFADAFAACWLGRRPNGTLRGGMRVTNWQTGYGYRPSVRQHRRICNAISVYALVADG